MSSRVWAGFLVIAFACLIRLPHADISWFGNDQIGFVAEGRRILAGDWNVAGPRAAGLNILGPLYSFLVAGLLWLRNDAGFLATVNAICEVAAAWFIYDTTRRVSGQKAGLAAGVAAGVLYATSPMLTISTRLIWNPSLLPAAIAAGCWLVVRYLERPSIARLAIVALACAITLTLHATAIFPTVAWVFVVLFGKRLSLKQLAVRAAIILLPFVPLLLRLGTVSDPGGSGQLSLAMNDALATLSGIGGMMLSFPVRANGEDWSAVPSAVILHFDAVIALVGLAIGLSRQSPYRFLWIGVALALMAHLAGAIVYPRPLGWYYFIGLLPLLCLSVGQAVGAWPIAARGAAVLIVALAMVHVVFVHRFDTRVDEMGHIRFETNKLTLRMPPSTPTYGVTVREAHRISVALRNTFPDGRAAIRASHGIRADLWRETGAEFMPRIAESRDDGPAEFVLMGAGATVLRPDARMVGTRECVFDSPVSTWRVLPGDPPVGWELPAFADDRWYPVDLPRRLIGSLFDGPAVPTPWRLPRQSLRGRMVVERPDGPHVMAVSVHSNASSQHWIAGFAVNGAEVPMAKNRMMQTSVYRNEEWLFDLTGRLQQGDNLIAVGLDGQASAFDIDVFELPCLDREWYNTDR